jgi:sec-independent protein translocase protein TatB
MADSLILMLLALVVFGPRRLPQIGRQIGKLMYEFRKASNDFKFQMEEELRLSEEADRRKKEEAQRQQAALAAPVQTIEAQAATGAAEAVSAPFNASPYPGETAYPEPEPVVTPRIMPPSTGEPVSAARPFAPEAQPEAQSGPVAEANPGAEPPATASEPAAQSTPTEPVSQHG